MTTKISPADIPVGDVVVYEYGIRMDADSSDEVSRQISMARRLYNDIVAVIRSTVDELQAFVVEKSGQGAIDLQAEIDRLTQDFDAARADNDEPSMSKIAAERREKWKALGAMLKDARKAHRAEIQTRFLSRIGRNSTCATYAKRSEAVAAGLGWATANATLDAALQAFKKSFALGKAPRFARGDEITQDCLTLQFTEAGGVPADMLLEGRHGSLSIIPSGGCGRRKYGEFKFRLGAAAADTWATGTWQYHRPIPEGASIALARLVRRRVGPHFKLAMQLLVKTREPVRISTGERLPLASIHFGWASDVEGRRVAGIAYGADPEAAQVIALPPEIEISLDRAASIQSERDNARDVIAARIKADLTLPDSAGEPLLEIAGKIRKTRAQGVSANRLHYLCRLLREEDRTPEWLEAWRHKDRLMWQDQTHIAKRARNARKTFYRKIALDLATRFEALAIEPLDLSAAAVKVDEVTGKKNELGKKARSGRVVAAIYEFESALMWAAAKAGTAILEVRGKTATTCSICGGGHLNADDGDLQMLHCADCGAALDRKQNGAAVAWQVASAQREDAVEDFWIAHLGRVSEAKEKKAGKLAKMADGRRKAQSSRTNETA